MNEAKKMGSLVEVTCSACGYSEQVSPGCGMAGVAQEAMVCEDCQRVRTVPISYGFADREGRFRSELTLHRCPVCGGGRLIDLSLGEMDGQRQTSVECPVCHDSTLGAAATGIWD